MLNSAILMGRLTADPELKYTQSNVAVIRITLAVERSYAKQGEERITDFIDVVAWRQTAEFVSRYFRKGQLVAVEGSIQTGSYTDRDGNKRKTFEVVAERVHFAEAKKDEPKEDGYRKQEVADVTVNQGDFEDFDDADIPF